MSALGTGVCLLADQRGGGGGGHEGKFFLCA